MRVPEQFNLQLFPSSGFSDSRLGAWFRRTISRISAPGAHLDNRNDQNGPLTLIGLENCRCPD
jgi:hypothetical protein